MNEELSKLMKEATELQNRFYKATALLVKPYLRKELNKFRKIVETLEEMNKKEEVID